MKLSQNLCVNVSMGADFTTDAIDISEVQGYGILGVFTGGGSPVGAFKLQAPKVLTDVASEIAEEDWLDVPDTETTVSGIGADGGELFYNFGSGQHYKWVRLVYTCTSGDATLNAVIQSKG
jgi:hypothetical protein